MQIRDETKAKETKEYLNEQVNLLETMRNRLIKLLGQSAGETLYKTITDIFDKYGENTGEAMQEAYKALRPYKLNIFDLRGNAMQSNDIMKYAVSLSKMYQQLNLIDKKFEAIIPKKNEFDNTESPEKPKEKTPPAPPPDPEDKEKLRKKQMETYLQNLEIEYKKRLLIIQENTDNEWKTEEEKNKLLLESEKSYLDKRIDYLSKFKTSYPKLQAEANEKLIDDQTKHHQVNKKLLDLELDDIQKNFNKELNAQKINLSEQTISEIDKLRRMDEADWSHYAKSALSITSGMLDSVAAYTKQISEMETAQLEAEHTKQLGDLTKKYKN